MDQVDNWRHDQTDILNGIEAELARTAEYLEFVVERLELEGSIWKVFVDLRQTIGGGLDESLEDAAAWWAGPPKGGADVLSVNPETEQINLRFATIQPPPPGQKIRIYPPRYLDALRDCWSNDEWAELFLEWLEQITHSNTFEGTTVPDAQPFQRWLRERQIRAFKLPGWQVGFLWGPPGTGKTTTLGAILAQYLVQFSSARVLLFSTTNAAVDLALVAVDKCLEQLAGSSGSASEARRRCFRIGNHFIARHYQGREHLLPVKDETLIRQLALLEAERPDPQDVQAYARWKEQVELVRQAIRQQAVGVLDSARLAAMTTTRAAFTFSDLYTRPRYDLIAFDEATQVGLAHALVVALLGRKTLFAGDPEQLAPIVKSEDLSARRWLGQSMFVHMNDQEDSTVVLNEQSRMAEPICRIVSNVFYKQQLVVASGCLRDPAWNSYREPVHVRSIGDNNTRVWNTDRDGTWSQRYHGWIRYGSAEFVRDLVCELKACQDEKDILVLTPFRAQRTLIRTFLRNENCSRVIVSTVHRAQGSERHTVIFDPVEGDSNFLNGEEARRLINVAISRAQARFVLILSPGDRKNPLLNQIASLIENIGAIRRATPICEFVSRRGFPACAVGHVVAIGRRVGSVTSVLNNGEKFMLTDSSTGEMKMYKTSVVVQNCREPQQ